MLILEDLWYGKVAPGERRYLPGSEYEKLLEKMADYERAVNAELTDAGKAAFKGYMDASGDFQLMAECDSFAAGFRAAALMMIDVFHPYPGSGREGVKHGTDKE